MNENHMLKMNSIVYITKTYISLRKLVSQKMGRIQHIVMKYLSSTNPRSVIDYQDVVKQLN